MFLNLARKVSDGREGEFVWMRFVGGGGNAYEE